MPQDVLTVTASGIYCEAGDFHIDPWRGVPRAIITHGHSDHARWGSAKYLATEQSAPILAVRLPGASVQTVRYGEQIMMNGVAVSLHPAGHLLGSAQVRVEHRGEVWVVTGDYKVEPDATCEGFEPIRCHTLISECTFGLPIYRWRPQQAIFDEMNAWWRRNQAEGRTSVLLCYALGKAQRVLAGLDATIGPILLHGTMPKLNEAYRQGGIILPETEYASPDAARKAKGRAMVLAPPSAAGTPWMKKFQPLSLAMASGWMQIRGTRRRRAMDRGFVLSDHADWDGLLKTFEACEAERIGLTHGYTRSLCRYLQETGVDAFELETLFEGEGREDASDPISAEEGEA